MKRKIIFTLLWMLASAAAIAGIGLPTVAILVRTAHEVSTVMYVHTTFGVLFIVAPLIALFLGLVGVLPGTQKRETDAA